MTERIPASDALADAETLRTYMWQHYARRYRSWLSHSENLAVWLQSGSTAEGLRNLASSIATDARRAVPGLRA